MPFWAWILIVVGIVVLAGVLVWSFSRQRTSKRLRESFGPEYERTVNMSGRRQAESELMDREKRREQLDIRPLDPAQGQRYAEAWRDTQARFVDSPEQAITHRSSRTIGPPTPSRSRTSRARPPPRTFVRPWCTTGPSSWSCWSSRRKTFGTRADSNRCRPRCLIAQEVGTATEEERRRPC